MLFHCAWLVTYSYAQQTRRVILKNTLRVHFGRFEFNTYSSYGFEYGQFLSFATPEARSWQLCNTALYYCLWRS